MLIPLDKIIAEMPAEEYAELKRTAEKLQENYPVDEDGSPIDWHEGLLRGWWDEQQRQPAGWFRWWDE